jgi:acetyltransferase-like isoleucine patch superfamily enzyme
MGTTEQRELKPTPEAEALYRKWISHLGDEFTRHQSADRRAEIVRDELNQLYLGRPHGGRMNTTLSSEWATNVLTETFDPRNATLRSEYYEGIDVAKFAPRKPLIWFWQMFDRSPLGLNTWLGLHFRCMLAHHIFGSLGKGVKIYRNVEFTYGYNVKVEDNCVIHRGVYLDDRDEILLRAGTDVVEGTRVEPSVPV